MAGLLLGIVFGMYRTELVLRERFDWQQNFHEQQIAGEVRIVGDWSQNSFSASVPVEWERCFSGECPAMRSLLTLSFVEPWLAGDRLLVDCKLVLPKNISVDFDYVSYLAKDNIGTQCVAKNMPKKLETASWQRQIFVVRNVLEESLARAIPEPENGLLAGLIFGGSGRLPKSLQDDFKKTGVSHIVAVSGYNVMIVAECIFLLGIAIGLWRRQAFWLVVASIGLFVVMTGASASVVRASIMALVVLLATQVRRLIAPWRLLIFVLTMMIWQNPMLLRYDVGFQLSFIATAVLLLVLSQQETREVTVLDAAWTVILSTLLIEIFVAPILLTQFGFVSGVSLISNSLLLPVVPVAMLMTFIAALCGFFLPLGVNIFAWVAYALAKYILFVVTFLASWPWATFSFLLTPWGIVVWYAGIGLVWWYIWHRKL